MTFQKSRAIFFAGKFDFFPDHLECVLSWKRQSWMPFSLTAPGNIDIFCQWLRYRHNTYIALQAATVAALYVTDRADAQPIVSSHWLWSMTNSHMQPCLPFNGFHPRNPCNYMDYYSFTDPERMEGWVGLVDWPIADTLPRKWSHVYYRSGVDEGKSSSQPKAHVLTTEPRKKNVLFLQFETLNKRRRFLTVAHFRYRVFHAGDAQSVVAVPGDIVDSLRDQESRFRQRFRVVAPLPASCNLG